jgi:hypothetical protein
VGTPTFANIWVNSIESFGYFVALNRSFGTDEQTDGLGVAVADETPTGEQSGENVTKMVGRDGRARIAPRNGACAFGFGEEDAKVGVDVGFRHESSGDAEEVDDDVSRAVELANLGGAGVGKGKLETSEAGLVALDEWVVPVRGLEFSVSNEKSFRRENDILLG